MQKAFFAKAPLDRVIALYSAWQTAPNLAGQFVELLSKNGTNANNIWDTVRDGANRLWLQHVMALEHQARIRIVKNALEHILLQERAGQADHIDWSALRAPGTFQRGLDQLREHPHRLQIPYFLQIFFEVFGGFLHPEKDRGILSAITGIPGNEINGCLGLLDIFFETQKGWFYSVKNELMLAKIVPCIWHGVGSFARQHLFKLERYDELCPSMGWLLSKWHNNLIQILAPVLEEKEPPKE